MKNKIIILIVAMTMSVLTGCQSSGKVVEEEIQDTYISIEDEVINDQSQDDEHETTENEYNDKLTNENEEDKSEATDNIIQNSGEVNNNNNNSDIVIEETRNESSDDANSDVGNGNLDNVVPSDDGDGQELLSGDLSTIIEKIYEIQAPGLKVGNIEVDLSNNDSVKYYTGLNDASKVKDVLVSEAMIGSQAYSLVLARVNDSADSQSVADEMLNGINPSKWICVTADDIQVASHDDLVLLIMVSTDLEDSATSQQIVDAFKKVCEA